MQPRLRESAVSVREQSAVATGASPMAESQPWRTWAKNFAICAAAGVFLALAGAMQTGELPLLIRLAYWVPLMMGGAIVGRALSAAVVLIPRATVSRWVFGFLLAVAISVPITGVVWIYTNTLFGAGMRLAELPQLFGSVLVISAAMTAIMIAVNWPGRITHSAPAAGGQRQVRFLERLPPKLRGAELYAVSAEDHYLRLHTSKGSDLILMRLSDAINELEGLEGAQTHRSWWVARNSIEGSRRDGDRVILLLKGGVEAPVSRPNVRPLRDNGWL